MSNFSLTGFYLRGLLYLKEYGLRPRGEGGASPYNTLLMSGVMS